MGAACIYTAIFHSMLSTPYLEDNVKIVFRVDFPCRCFYSLLKIRAAVLLEILDCAWLLNEIQAFAYVRWLFFNNRSINVVNVGHPVL